MLFWYAESNAESINNAKNVILTTFQEAEGQNMDFKVKHHRHFRNLYCVGCYVTNRWMMVMIIKKQNLKNIPTI